MRTKHTAYALLTAGFLGLGISAWLYYHAQATQQKPTDAIHMANAPTATKPTAQAVASYTVAPDLPKYIAVPSIHVAQARVIRLGHMANGQIATPDNIYDTGWYQDSAKPGQSGAMFIFGHVSNWSANGIFFNLKKLRPGDTVTVTRGDNKQFTYRVVSTKTYPSDKVDMHAVLSPVDTAKPGLNLMTCTGNIIKGTSEFDTRLVVFTTLVNG